MNIADSLITFEPRPAAKMCRRRRAIIILTVECGHSEGDVSEGHVTVEYYAFYNTRKFFPQLST